MRPGLSITFALIAVPAIAEAAEQELLERFASSRASLTSYVGSGTFVSNPYSDNPLFTQALSLNPTFSIFEDLSASAGFNVECELTDPDRRNGRRCSAGDLSLSLSSGTLYRDPWLDGQFRASFSTYLPTSLESRYNNTIVNLRAAGAYSVHFFEKHLSAGLSFAGQKYLPSRATRGPNGPEQSADFPKYLVRASALEDLAPGSGGPMNDNWGFTTSANVGWRFNEELSASLTLGVYNLIRRSVPDDFFNNEGLLLSGRADFTSGSLEVSWAPLDHFGLDFGVTTAQPALNYDRSLRFPFYDFSTPSNNFTRWYLAVHLTY